MWHKMCLNANGWIYIIAPGGPDLGSDTRLFSDTSMFSINFTSVSTTQDTNKTYHGVHAMRDNMPSHVCPARRAATMAATRLYLAPYAAGLPGRLSCMYTTHDIRRTATGYGFTHITAP